jgi:iron complex transport system ATP-binding protein
VRELVGFGRFPAWRRADDRGGPGHHRGGASPSFDLAGLADRFARDGSPAASGSGRWWRWFIAQGTDYLLLDEPLNNLDMYYARELMRSLRTVADEKGKTIVIVLHDINQASAHADRIIAMKAGRIVADLGRPAAILTPDRLETVFGFPMRVETIEGKPFVLHQL